MWRCIIHSWMNLLHCILCTCIYNLLLLYYHRNFICRRPHSFCFGHIQHLSEYRLPDPAERVYLILPYLYLDWYKRKWPKHPLASINHKELCIQAIKSIQGTNPAGKIWYDSLKSIFVTVKMIRSSSDHAVFSWVYNN